MGGCSHEPRVSKAELKNFVKGRACRAESKDKLSPPKLLAVTIGVSAPSC